MDSSGFIAAMVQRAQEMFSAFLKRTDGGFLVKIRVCVPGGTPMIR